MADAIDFVLNDILNNIKLNLIKNNYPGTATPSNPGTGTKSWDTANKVFKLYNGAAWVNAIEASDKFPIGSILFWNPGYYTDGINGGYTRVLGDTNDVAGANSYLNASGWYVGSGAAVNVAASTIWNAAGRYLPNISDDRFLMGDTIAGTTGGSSTRAHTHNFDFDSKTSDGASNWYRSPYDSGGTTIANYDHTHDWDIPSFETGVASETENRPLFLSLFAIVRVF